MMNKLKSSSPLALSTHCKLYIDIYMLKKSQKSSQLKYLSKSTYSSSDTSDDEKSLK